MSSKWLAQKGQLLLIFMPIFLMFFLVGILPLMSFHTNYFILHIIYINGNLSNLVHNVFGQYIVQFVNIQVLLLLMK